MGKCRPGLNIEDSPNWDNSIYVEGDLPPNTIAFDDMDLGCGPPRSVDAPTPSLEGYWDRDDVDGTLYPKQLSDAVMVGKTAPSYDEVFGVVGKIYSSAGYMMGPGTQLIYASDSTTMGIYVEDRHSLYIEGGHIRGAQENAPMINTEDVTTSESTPPYTFYTDQDTGMYRPAANTLGFTVGGMIALILTSIGYLNIPVVPATAASASVPVLARNASTGLVEQRVLTELHTHSNKEVLDLLTAPAGSLMYNGTLVFDPSPYYTATEVDDLDAILQADIDTRSLNTHNHNLADLAERNYTSLLGLPDLSDLHSHDNKATLDRMPDYTTATQDDVMVRDGGGIAWKPLSAVTSGHWLRDTTGDPFLYPTVAGDNVKIDATIFVDALSEYEADAGVTVEGNELKDGGITLGTGPAVNTIETTLTDDDSHLPTSGAVYDAIDAAVAGEDLWDRAGTVLSPVNAGDTIKIAAPNSQIEIEDSDDNQNWTINANAGYFMIYDVDNAYYPFSIRNNNTQSELLKISNNQVKVENTIDSLSAYAFWINQNPVTTQASASTMYVRGETSASVLQLVQEGTGHIAYFMDSAAPRFIFTQAGVLQVNTIDELTGSAGVTVEGNKLKDGGITLGAGATVNEIETTLTNDATHMPTSAAVYAAIGALPTYSFSNGLTETAGAVKLGGPLTGTTDLTNAVAGTYALNIGTSSNYIGAFTVNAEGISLIGRNNSNISFYTGTGLINLQGDTVITSTKVIGTQTSVDNTYSLAAYDTDGTAYTNFITFTAGTTPTMTFPQSGGGTTNFLNADGGWSAPAGTIPVDNILDWNGTAYAPYSAQTTGAFDSSATNPISAVNRLNFDGEFYAYNIYAANATDYITITSGGQVIIHTGGADQMIFQPYVSDGAGAYGYSFDTENTLSTEGSKVATFKNNGTEVFTIYGGGQLLISERTVTGLPTPTATHGFIYMDAADDKLYFVNSATTYDLTSTGGSATFIGLTDTPADWTGGVGGYMVMVNSTPDAVEFINPGAYPINNFSGTLDGSMTILGSNTNYFDIKHAHATTGSIHLDTSTAADIGIIAYTGTDWTGNYAALYVGQQYANLVVEFSPNVKQLLINATAMLVTDSEDGIGLQYVADYSTAGKTLGARWIPDWNAVITQLGGQNVHTTITGPTVTEDGMVVYWDNTNSRYDLKTAGGAAHALLSATHTDTAAVAVARGAIIYGDATPQWNRLTISATVTHLLRTDGTDVSWGAFNFADLGTSTHASTHENEGADEISVTGLSGLLADGQTPLSHTHGNITNAGAIGSTINLPIITTTSGVLTVGSFGTGAYTFCVGNDSRLSDARTPTAHASSHLSSGGDAISLFATASTVSGLVPGSNSVGATYYLNATGNWTVPAGGGGDVFADSYTTTDLAIWGSTAKHLTDTAGKLTWNGSVLTIDDSLTATYVGIGQAASSSYGLYSIHAGTPGWFTRNKGTAVEGTAYAAMALELKTTNQVNTGGYFYFKLTTSGGGPYNMAAFGAMRDGADTTAKLEFYSYYTATRQLRMTVGADDANSSYLAVSAVNNSGDAEVRFLQATYQRGVIGWDDSADGGTGGINIETGTLTATPAIFVGNENHVCIGGQTDHSTYELYVAGDIYATGDITGNSDIRYKDVLGIVPFTWEDYMALTPIRYRSKLKENSNPTFGFSAQEMMQHWKEPVTYDYDTERYGMKYNAIIPINTTAIQKLKAEKDELEKRVAYLENEIHNLKYA